TRVTPRSSARWITSTPAASSVVPPYTPDNPIAPKPMRPTARDPSWACRMIRSVLVGSGGKCRRVGSCLLRCARPAEEDVNGAYDVRRPDGREHLERVLRPGEFGVGDR